MARTEQDRTPGKTIRVPNPMWNAYRTVLERLDTNPTADIHARIREIVEAHGTAEERALVEAGERELEQRKEDRYRRAAQTRRTPSGD